MARNSTPLTDSEREQRRQAQRRQFEDALSALLSSDGWKRWLRTRATLHTYSANNTLLIAHQAWARGITPTHVAGFRAWLKLGRCVRKGERGLSIWAPMRLKARDADGEETTEQKTVFRVAKVFDVSQTTPLEGTKPAPLSPPCAPIEGDSHAHLLDPLVQLARDLGYTVVWSPEIAGGAKGLCRRRARRIEVLATLAPNYRVAVLVPWRKWRIRTCGIRGTDGRLVVCAGRSDARRASEVLRKRVWRCAGQPQRVCRPELLLWTMTTAEHHNCPRRVASWSLAPGAKIRAGDGCGGPSTPVPQARLLGRISG